MSIYIWNWTQFLSYLSWTVEEVEWEMGDPRPNNRKNGIQVLPILYALEKLELHNVVKFFPFMDS